MTFSPDASDVYRTHVTKFVPSSGYNQPSLDEIRALLAQYEAVMNGFTTNGGLIYQTMAAMNAAATTFTEPRSAWQFEAGSEGVYVLNPSTDTWTKVGRLPYDFVIGTDTGAGTENAIQITTDIPVADGMIVAFSLFEATTSSPVTVSINGGTALTLVTNRGNNASALSAGMEVWGRYRGSDNTLRLLNDQDVSALVGQAEAARDAAVAAANSNFSFDSFADIALSEIPLPVLRIRTFGYYAIGDGGGANYKRIATPGAPKAWQIQSADGAWWEIDEETPHCKQFGTMTDRTAAQNDVTLQAQVDWVVAQDADIDRRKMKISRGLFHFNQFVIPDEGRLFTLEGEGKFASVLWRTVVSSTPAIVCETESPTFKNCSLQQPISGTSVTDFDSVGVQCKRPVGSTADIDVTFDNFRTTGFRYGREIVGRGAKGRGEGPSLCEYAYKLGWPDIADYVEGEQPVQKDATGFRYFDFQQERWHSCLQGGIHNKGPNAAKINGMLLNGISMDIGRTAIDGAFRQGAATGFAITQTPQEGFKLRDGSASYFVGGGVIAGEPASSRVPSSFARFYGNHQGGRFGPMLLDTCSSHAILHDGTDGVGGAVGTGAMTGVVFDGLFFNKPCTGGTGNVFRITGPGHIVYIDNIVVYTEIALPGVVRGTSGSSTIVVGPNVRVIGPGAASTPIIDPLSLGVSRSAVTRSGTSDFTVFSEENGTQRGSIGRDTNGTSGLSLKSTEALLLGGTSIRPLNTGISLGNSADTAQRFDTIFLVNAPNVSSDARLKTPLRQLTAAELSAALEIGKLIGAYNLLADQDGPEHIGVIAQSVVRVMNDHGLVPFDYAFIDKDLETGMLSIVYQELLAFVLRALVNHLGG